MSVLARYEGWVASRYALADRADERYEAVSPRGTRLPLRRHLPRGPEHHEAPVVLCPGLGGNAVSLELGGAGLAPFLASRGFDVHVAALSPAPRATQADVDLETWIRDGRAIADRVRERTGRRELHWVGHSLGGLLPLFGGYRALRSIVGVGPPFGAGLTTAAPQLRAASRIARWLGDGKRVPLARLARLEAPLMGRLRVPAPLAFVSPPNLEGETTRALHAHGTEDLPAGVVRDLLAWSEAGDDRRLEGALERSGPPVIFVVGTSDPFGPVEAARALARRWSGRLDVVVAGAHAHVELVAGPRAAETVFAPVARVLGRPPPRPAPEAP